MSLLNLCTKYTAARATFINEIISLKQDGIESYYDLPNVQQQELVGYLLKAIDPPFMFEWLCDHRHSQDFIVIVADALLSGDYADVREQICDQATDWFAESIEELFLELEA